MTTVDPVVIWPEPPRFDREELVEQLGAILRDRVVEAYLIGSHADGSADGDSDVDLILVADTNRPWPDRGTAFVDLYDRFGDVDLLVYTPTEWRSLQEAPTAFLAHASRTWARIH